MTEALSSVREKRAKEKLRKGGSIRPLSASLLCFRVQPERICKIQRIFKADIVKLSFEEKFSLLLANEVNRLNDIREFNPFILANSSEKIAKMCKMNLDAVKCYKRMVHQFNKINTDMLL